MSATPAAPVRKKARGRNRRLRRHHAGLPRAMVYGLLRALLGDHAWLPPSPARRRSVCTNLAPASERQDHTTSPSATALLVCAKDCAQHVTSTAIPLRVRDDRDTPLVSAKSARMCERAVLTNRPSLNLSPFVLEGQEPAGERGTDPVSSSTRTVAWAF